ncbi:Sortilin-related receptor [Papilio xuthus]|uniref:Sortilin-related receptor n=1 Tax=Papilio xuthus TaxID=66420 RepID=A0A194PV57_PAPXU|nr:Sortilin-related receptor [Papilio xuthus]
MVNGNYVLYGDRPSSESEIVEDHVHARAADKKTKRKPNRTANELQYSLNLAQLDNETDSVKYEKKVKEPRLLRYVPTTDVEEHFVSEKFETYDLKATEEPPRRYAFTKKPKNPADGSVNYAYSRSSSSCSSPNGNLPTISEHGEQFSTYRIRSIRTPTDEEVTHAYETKLDKYFSRPREVKTFVAKGSHPDSLYRVPVGSGVTSSKVVRVLRILRWPVALFSVCIALAIFVYFLMPDNLSSELSTVNATSWQEDTASAQSRIQPGKPSRKPPEQSQHGSHKGNIRTKPQEIDFYDAENVKTIDLTSLMETVTEKSEKRTPIPPVFPTHIVPEVQYGNERVDNEKMRSPKLIDTVMNSDESTLKPHITQSPERPLAIYFDEGKVAASTETITRAESNNDILHYDEKELPKTTEESTSKPYSPVYKDSSMYIRKEHSNSKQRPTEPDLTQALHDYYRLTPINNDNRFTSGHSKLFGISMEDAQSMKSTTQSTLYNTRVSPTLPTWRDNADSTTKKYPLNTNLDVSHCRSTHLGLCRGVLPYDLAGPAATLDGIDVTDLLPQMEYLVSSNCSERTAHFLCTLLEPECSPTPYLHKMPCYSLCRAVAEHCDGSIPRDLLGVFGCTRYPTGGCAAARSPCGARELPCGDGSCVPSHWACDGAADCPAAEDEAHCAACASNEFRCPSGGCVHTRWLCDGYADCPRGEDEAEQQCAARRDNDDEQVADAEPEPGEEPAGSAPALAVRRPFQTPKGYADDSVHRNGETESSKEILMTSDSKNGLKRNFTRRPSPSRLSPYSRPIIHDTKTQSKGKLDTRVKTKTTQRKASRTTLRTTTTSQHMPEDNKENVRESISDMGVHLDKSINNLEKKAGEPQEETGESGEGKGEGGSGGGSGGGDKTEEPRSHRGTGRYSSPARAHASPCPSGELRCVDGRCITLAQLCDGTIDCSDHADEDNCYT